MRITEENKKRILELQSQGLGKIKISRLLSIPKTTVERYMIKGFRKPKQKIEINCANCGSSTFNPKFCSSSCSAKSTNRNRPKRIKKINYCAKCNTIVNRSKFCAECRKAKDMTLQEVVDRYGTGKKASLYSLVRERARKAIKEVPNVCSKCGYSKHVEVCHIKAISTYPLDTMVSEINRKENLIKLCPNCHWESEHSLDIQQAKTAAKFINNLNGGLA